LGKDLESGQNEKWQQEVLGSVDCPSILRDTTSTPPVPTPPTLSPPPAPSPASSTCQHPFLPCKPHLPHTPHLPCTPHPCQASNCPACSPAVGLSPALYPLPSPSEERALSGRPLASYLPSWPTKLKEQRGLTMLSQSLSAGHGKEEGSCPEWFWACPADRRPPARVGIGWPPVW
jgi:hypothetical protein